MYHIISYAREDMNIEAAQAAVGTVFDTEIHLENFGRDVIHIT